MKKIFTKLIGATLGLAMAIGVSVGVASNKQAKRVEAVSNNSDLALVTNRMVLSTTKKYVYATTLSETTYYLTSTKPSSGWGGYTTNIAEATEWNVSAANVGDFHLTNGEVNVSSLTSNSFSYIASTPGSSNRSAVNAVGNLINKTTTDRNLRYNGTGFRWYSGSGNGTEAFLYEVSTGFDSLNHIMIAIPASKLSFEVGETFNCTGLVLTGYDGVEEATSKAATYSSGFSTNYDGHVFAEGDLGAQTVTVTYSGKTTTYSINVEPAADIVHTYASNSIFGNWTGAQAAAEEKTHTPESAGPEYITLGGYNYADGEAMSFYNVDGLYFGNNEEYTISTQKKYIDKIVIETTDDYTSKLTMTEGSTVLPSSNEITPDLSNENKTLAYTFSGDTAFFKLAKSTSSYVNITRIKVFLGGTITSVIDTVSASINEGVRYEGSTLSASDFSVTVTWTAGKAPTNPVDGFTWTVNGVENGALVAGNNAIVLTYLGESCAFNYVGRAFDAPYYLASSNSYVSLNGNESLSNSTKVYTLTFGNAGYVDATNLPDSIGIGPVFFGYDKNNGTQPKYYNSDKTGRFYNKNILSFLSTSNITSIVFTASDGDLSKISAEGFAGTTWTGSSTSVEFNLSGTAKITSIAVTCESSYSVDSVAMRFGATIAKDTWDTINASWAISDYGVMFVKKGTLDNDPAYSTVNTVAEAYNAGKQVATVNKGSGAAPYLNGDDYLFTVRVNITAAHNIVYCAAPFVVAGGQYYFLDEIQYSVSSLAKYYVANGGSALSSSALLVLAGAVVIA